MSKTTPILSSSQPDPAVLDDLAWVQYGFLAVVSALGAVILCAWLVPPLGRILPAAWSVMKANTALLTLLSALSLASSLPKRSPRTLLIGRGLAIFVTVFAAAIAQEYLFKVSFGIDTLLAADTHSLQPGRMSPQSAGAFLLLGVVMCLIRERKRFTSYIADLFAFCYCLLVLAIVSGYLFGATHMFGASVATRTAPHTLVALSLLAFVVFSRRAEYGTFSILLGVGISGKIARIACPFALGLPFVLSLARAAITHAGDMSPEYASALATSIGAMTFFALVLALSWRIDRLEKEIRDLSLRDGLTELYNRRGFYVLAEQALRLAQRSRAPFSVLFVDLDNLKVINDSLGHDAGSAFLSEVADLLRSIFHSTDVMGRIGGDEFVIAGEWEPERTAMLARRLQDATDRVNAMPNRLYPLGFSLGSATLRLDGLETLDELLSRADTAMYQAKQEKKRALRAVSA